MLLLHYGYLNSQKTTGAGLAPASEAYGIPLQYLIRPDYTHVSERQHAARTGIPAGFLYFPIQLSKTTVTLNAKQ